MSIMMKSLAIVIALGFFAGSASADSPKSYRISLSTVSKIGTVELQPGDYKLLVDTHNPKVQFTEVNGGKTIELEAKVETVETKFESTAIHSNRADGTNRIIEIRIGGSKTKVAFD
jgi:hypothetical protein